MSFKNQIDVAEQLLNKIEIPLLPKEVLDLQTLFNKSDMPDPQEVKRLISSNPFLAGELICLANLPTLSSRSHIQIKDIDSAIYRLGNKQLKNFILSIYVKKLLNNPQIKGLSYHSQNIAIISAEIARFSRFMSVDEAYLLGLMHDIGSFALSELDNVYGQTFVGKLVDHYTSHKLEYAEFGTTHSALGYVIAKSWRISNFISQSILLHHEPNLHSIKNEKLRHYIAIIEMAHAISIKQKHAKQPSAEADSIYEECQAILELSDEQLHDIQVNVKELLF
ncbi:HDOD domain-containing protein [Thiomicrorhabdus chilensis]|uniref:HDOD domain-containing protein n=1 Tax=Thiomicrorhabdus chilensis TaxID=63656 RepID=UPI0004160F33|nr:HDOD domain-containing protein [Thiomicrorhabdus chilensis]